jgi:prevent-host-death family protein
MEVTMATLSTVEARERFADLIDRAADDKERVVLTRDGRGIVAVVPIEDLELLQDLEDRLDVEEAMAALAEAKEKGTIPLEALKADLGL